MNDNRENPARLRERRDQPDLVERIAGQAARDVPEPPQLTASALARIAMRIEERTSRPHALRWGRVLVAASVLLGIVTVASAAHMDLMPRWIAKMVGMESMPALTEPRTRPGKTRNGVKKAATAVVPGPSQEGAQPEMVPAPEEVSEGAAAGVFSPMRAQTVPAESQVGSRGTLAMARVRAENRGHEGGRTTVGHLYDHDHGQGNGQGNGHAQGDAQEASAKTRASRLAAKSAAFDTTPSARIEAPPTMVLPSSRPSPIAARTQAPVVTSAVPSERPAVSVPPAPAPAQAPSPVPVAAGPTRSPAAGHLKEAVRALRVERAPRTALQLLDRHAPELVGTAFAEEALLLRVEAMLALKKQPEALRLLDGMSLANAASSSVLLLTRGQLRASANRCAEAVADFDLLLARSLRPSKQALLGRAQCKQKLGDLKGAQSDLDRLHREFPGEPGR